MMMLGFAAAMMILIEAMGSSLHAQAARELAGLDPLQAALPAGNVPCRLTLLSRAKTVRLEKEPLPQSAGQSSISRQETSQFKGTSARAH